MNARVKLAKIIKIINEWWSMPGGTLVDLKQDLMDSNLIWPYDMPMPKYWFGDTLYRINKDRRWGVAHKDEVISIGIEYEPLYYTYLLTDWDHPCDEKNLFKTRTEAQTECDKRNGKAEVDEVREKLKQFESDIAQRIEDTQKHDHNYTKWPANIAILACDVLAESGKIKIMKG